MTVEQSTPATVLEAVRAARPAAYRYARKVVTIVHNITEEEQFLLRSRPSGPRPADRMVPVAEFTVGLNADIDMVTDPAWGDALLNRRGSDVESVSGAFLARLTWTLTHASWSALCGDERQLAIRLSRNGDRPLREGDAVLVGPYDEEPAAYCFGERGVLLRDLAELTVVNACGAFSTSLLCTNRRRHCWGKHGS